MLTPSLEDLRSTEKKLLASGVLRYEDGPFYEMLATGDKLLTQQEADVLCTAVWVAEQANTTAPEVKKDKSKGGRPKKGDAKLKCIYAMVSPARFDQLHATAEDLGIKVSQLVRPLIDPAGARGQQRVGKLLKKGLSLEERKQLRELTGMSANLNQLARLALTEGYAEQAIDLTTLAEKIRSLVKSFSK